ncbi:MAG: 16S rRNA (adenine(1518)-N(6)/adenine(1519)-N(6))-dimethyltransferase [Deltaproteobacteria bacterium]|nr:16S rRNA (adenine(1518)-N(6)/adenine(1519)-N(6))-dimethyltransferase [Deltaproteobacteria bacterium]MBW2419733.1 16S rRNA (adenine(1518)-N(6)/adenine(1519)-N(6))-dimethyltransferase [Deltaproteobacteria bacterium]
MSVSSVRATLERHGLYLRKDLGQNFLVDDDMAERLAELAGVAEGDRILEVGTGLGVLTRALAARAARVISVEIDSGLVRALESEGALPDHVSLVHADALKLDLGGLLDQLAEGAVGAEGRAGPAGHEGQEGEEGRAAAPRAGALRVVANLPYSAATPLLRRLLDLRGRLADWSVMLQSEVARRLSAEVGSRDYGSFAVLHQLCVDVDCCKHLGPSCFFPAPRVDSDFLRITPRLDSPLARDEGVDELRRVERVVRAAFAQRRKTVSNALRGGGFGGGDRAVLVAALEGAQIDPGARAETIEPERWLELSRLLEI